MKKLILTLLLLSGITAFESNAQGGCTAMYQYTMGMCPEILFFDASVGAGPNDPIVSWIWDFGDGNVSTTQNPTNVYQSNGMYSVCLIIQTASGCFSTYCDSIQINCITQPSCLAGYQYTLANCPSVSFFDGSSSSGNIISWDWSFGDGGTDNNQNPSHTYTANGNYLACLTIMTDDSCTNTYCDTIVINCINGLEDLHETGVQIAPNPVVDQLAISLEDAASIEYSLYDLNGRLFLKGNSSINKTHSIDLDLLETGFYLLEVYFNGKRIQTKIFKE